MLTRRLVTLLPAALAAGPALAHSYRHGDLMIGHAWCLPSAGDTTQAFMPLAVTGGRADTLIEARCDVATAIEFRTTAGGPAAPRWEILPQRPIGMRRDGPHLLLTGLKQRLEIRARFPLTLVFERNGPKQVDIWVEDKPYSS